MAPNWSGLSPDACAGFAVVATVVVLGMKLTRSSSTLREIRDQAGFAVSMRGRCASVVHIDREDSHRDTMRGSLTRGGAVR